MEDDPIDKIFLDFFRKAGQGAWLRARDVKERLSSEKAKADELKTFGVTKMSTTFVSKRLSKLVGAGKLRRYPPSGHGKRVVYQLIPRPTGPSQKEVIISPFSQIADRESTD